MVSSASSPCSSSASSAGTSLRAVPYSATSCRPRSALTSKPVIRACIVASTSHARSRSGPAGAASDPGSATRSPTTVAASSPAGSSRISAAPASTCAFTTASTSRTRPDDRRPHRRLHLHALEDDDRLAGLDLVPDARADGDDDGRRRRAHQALLVPGDPVRDAVHLDQVRRRGVRGHDREALAADGQPALQRAEPVDLDVDVAAVEPHPVAAGVHLRDGQLVGLPAVAELDHPADVVRGARPPAAGRGEERGPLQGLLGVGDVDRHLDQRDGRVAARGRRRRWCRCGPARRCRRCRPRPPGGRAGRAGRTSSSSRRGSRPSSRAARRAGGRAPRAGPGPRR